MEALESALKKGEQWLLGKQDSERGFWVEELEADTTLTSEYVMLRRFLGVVDPERERKAVRYLLQIGRACVGKECRSRWSPYH